MPDAAYYRAWRAAHPEYRKRQNDLKQIRRAKMTPEERRKDRGPGRPRCAEPCELPPLHCGCDLFDHAKRLVRLSPGYKYLTHPFYDDLVSEIVLALIEGRSPLEARSDFLKREYQWRKYAIQVRDGYEPFEGSLISQGSQQP